MKTRAAKRLAGVLLGLMAGYTVALLWPTDEGFAMGAFVALFTGTTVATW